MPRKKNEIVEGRSQEMHPFDTVSHGAIIRQLHQHAPCVTNGYEFEGHLHFDICLPLTADDPRSQPACDLIAEALQKISGLLEVNHDAG